MTFDEMLAGIELGQQWRRLHWDPIATIRMGTLMPDEVQMCHPSIEPCGFTTYIFKLYDYKATDWVNSNRQIDEEAQRLRRLRRERKK